jgi:hypothetical protein
LSASLLGVKVRSAKAPFPYFSGDKLTNRYEFSYFVFLLIIIFSMQIIFINNIFYLSIFDDISKIFILSGTEFSLNKILY